MPDPAPGAEPERGFSVLVVPPGADPDDELTELAELMRTAGVEPVGPVASVGEALAELDRGGIDAEILDINLGEESALGLADELERRAIPYAFATGYSADDVLPPERAKLPLLAKPYSAAEVMAVLDTLRGSRGG